MIIIPGSVVFVEEVSCWEFCLNSRRDVHVSDADDCGIVNQLSITSQILCATQSQNDNINM